MKTYVAAVEALRKRGRQEDDENSVYQKQYAFGSFQPPFNANSNYDFLILKIK